MNAAINTPGFEIPDPCGGRARIPAEVRDDHPYFRSLDSEAARFLEEEGYVVLRGLIDPDACARIREAFASEVKPYRGFLYRQTTARAERHQTNAHGHVMNPLLNLQDLDAERFPRLRQTSLDAFTVPPLVAALSTLFGETPKLVQTMYFEGNSTTWAHQDTYYLDSERLGDMMAAWIALEDIHPGAGRFFVYPKSHRIDMRRNGGDFDIAFHHDRYKALILEVIRKHELELRAPALGAGDVLLWKAKTIHGSLATQGTSRTRQSLTAHYLPESHRLLALQSLIRPLKLRTHNGISVHCPKSQDRLVNRATLFLESRLPRPFYFAKRIAVKIATR
jgi:phytanoyl-CoA hydroxylase